VPEFVVVLSAKTQGSTCVVTNTQLPAGAAMPTSGPTLL
jgi:hypothetical protein